MAHGLRCLCVRGACCPSLAKQLVILSFFEVPTGTVICCYNSMCTGMSRVGMNVPLTNKPCKQVRARTPVSRACEAHGLRCLCVRGACCPSLLKQLVILSFFEVSTGTVICCYNSMCTGMYRVGLNVPLKNKPCKQVRARTLCHERVWRTVCSVCAYGARVAHHLPSNS